MLLVLAFGEGLNLARLSGGELLMFLFFPLGLCVELMVAWRLEVLGGGITVASLAGFYLVDSLLSSSFPRGCAFALLAVPGFLFPAVRSVDSFNGKVRRTLTELVSEWSFRSRFAGPQNA